MMTTMTLAREILTCDEVEEEASGNEDEDDGNAGEQTHLDPCPAERLHEHDQEQEVLVKALLVVVGESIGLEDGEQQEGGKSKQHRAGSNGDNLGGVAAGMVVAAGEVEAAASTFPEAPPHAGEEVSGSLEAGTG